MKKALSLITAFTAVAALTVSSFAAGYGNNPGYTPSQSSSSEVSSSTVTSAVQSGESINIATGGAVSLSTLEQLIASNKDNPNAALNFVSKEKGNEYEVEIPLDSIKDARAINVSLKLKSSEGTTLLIGGEKVSIPEGSLYIVPSMKGDFGMDLVITFPKTHFTKVANADGMKLVYVNNKTAEATVIDSFIPFNADGSVTVTLKKASSYYLVPATEEDKAAAAVEDVDVGDDDTDDAPVLDDDFDDDDDVVADDFDDDDDFFADDDDDIFGEADDDDSQDGSDEKAPWYGQGSDDDENPSTSVAIGGGVIAGLSAAVAVLSKKRKNNR